MRRTCVLATNLRIMKILQKSVFLYIISACNVLLQGDQGIYTLRNYGQRINCSVSAIFPSHIEVVSMSIGVQGRLTSVEMETGVKNQVS